MGILVLGGSGFIGSRVVERLARHGDDAVSYDVVDAKRPGVNARFVKADLLEPLALERVFFDNDIDTVVHLVGLPDIAHCERDPQLSFALNVQSLQNTLEPMRKANVGYVIFASSAAVYGYNSKKPVAEESLLTPNTVYGFHKMIGEKMVEAYSKSYGIKFAVLRLFNVYGADPSTGKDVISVFLRRAMDREPLSVKGPKKFRDFVHVDDVAEVVSRIAWKRPLSAVFNVGTGSKVTLGFIADSVKKRFKEVKVNLEGAQDDGSGIYADISKLRGSVRVKFRDSEKGIQDHIAAFARGTR